MACATSGATEPGRAAPAVPRRTRQTGNQPPLPSIFPDQLAPVVRMAKDRQREAIRRLRCPHCDAPVPASVGSRSAERAGRQLGPGDD
jgi:hypothetical protein